MKLSYFLQLLMLIVLAPQAILAEPPIQAIIQRVLRTKPEARIKALINTAKKLYLIKPSKKIHKKALINKSRKLYQVNTSTKIRAQKLTQLKKTAQTLTKATVLLHLTAGFAHTLHRALISLGQPNCIGYIYEIKKALEITHANINKTNSEKVLSMNTIIQIPCYPYEISFDLITTKQHIECKAGKLKSLTTKLRNQFLRQQQTLAFLNQAHGTSLQYAVHTPTKLSFKKIKWFEEHGISVVVDKT